MSLREYQELFGGGPLAAFIGVLLVAVVVLFWQLIRSMDRRAKAADEMRALAREVVESTTRAIAENTMILQLVRDSLEETEQTLRDARFELQLAQSRRTSTRRTATDPEAKTVVMPAAPRPPKEPG